MRVSSPAPGTGRRPRPGVTATMPGAAVVVPEPIGEQAGRAARSGGIRPVRGDPGVEQRVVDARVVGDPAGGGTARARRTPRSGSVEYSAGRIQPARELGHDPQLVAHAGGRLDGPATAQHATFEVRHRALLLGPLGDRKHDIRQLRPSRRGRSPTRRAGRASPAPRARRAAFGADTTRFEPCTSIARGPSGVPREASSSTAGTPGPGIVSGATPHTPATWARAAGSVILRYPGS